LTVSIKIAPCPPGVRREDRGVDQTPTNTLHNCCVALARSSALVTPLVSGSTSGTLAFADANANVSCSETLVAINSTRDRRRRKKGEEN
jgi:hypothetical protein